MDRTSQAEETVRRYSDMVYRLAFARTGTPQTLRMCTRRSFSATSAATPSSPRRSTGSLAAAGHYQLRQKASCGALAAADGAPQ